MAAMSATTKQFVLHWGEMGTRWGVNRTVAQIHALLFLSPKPLSADDLVEVLGVARSNVSNSLRELQGWGIVRIVHLMGDRRDHFVSLKDVWEMFQIILDERKKRECDPTLAVLRELAAQAKEGGKRDEYAAERIKDMLEFFESMTQWYASIRSWPGASVRKLVRLGDRLKEAIGLT